MICATYILTLHGPDGGDTTHRIYDASLRETEENLTDLMPRGYWVEIQAFETMLDNATEEELPDG